MKAERYLVLIHFAARATRANLGEVAHRLGKSIRSNLNNSEVICTTPASLVFVGESGASVDSLFRSLAGDLLPGDNLSVLVLGGGIATSHPGLLRWSQLK